MPRLTFSNKLISRYEGLHTDFACPPLQPLEVQSPPEAVKHIIPLESHVWLRKRWIGRLIRAPVVYAHLF